MRSRWRRTILKKSYTLKLDWFGVVWNMKGKVLVISKTNFVLVADKLFPSSDDQLGKCRLNFCIGMDNSSWEVLNDLINLFLMGACFNVMNKNRFKMLTPLLKLLLLKLRFKFQKFYLFVGMLQTCLNVNKSGFIDFNYVLHYIVSKFW